MPKSDERQEALKKAQILRDGFNFFKAKPTNVDRKLCRRERPIELLCLGLSRTGTACKSFHESLKLASVPCEGRTDPWP